MQKIHGNTFKCEVGETVTMTFKPSDDGKVRVLYKEKLGDNLVDVGDDFQLERKIGTEQVKIEVVFVFFPNDPGNCGIFLQGDASDDSFEDKPPATEQPGLPEHRTYRFVSK